VYEPSAFLSTLHTEVGEPLNVNFSELTACVPVFLMATVTVSPPCHVVVVVCVTSNVQDAVPEVEVDVVVDEDEVVAVVAVPVVAVLVVAVEAVVEEAVVAAPVVEVATEPVVAAEPDEAHEVGTTTDTEADPMTT